MSTIGENLKRERELRDISVEEIAEFTKILPRFIRSLEENKFDDLPAGVFTRGFIRAYSQFIGVNGDDMVNIYLQQIQKQDSILIEETEEEPESGMTSHILLFAAISIVLVAVVSVVLYLSRGEEKESSPFKTITNSDNVLPEKGSEQGVTVPVPEFFDGSVTEKTEPFEMKVVIIEESWVQVSADGQNRLEGVLQAGEERSFTAGSLFRISSGNAGGIKIFINEAEMPALGDSGEVVRDIEFISDNHSKNGSEDQKTEEFKIIAD